MTDPRTRTFPSTRETVSDASAFVLETLQALGVQDEVIDGVLLAVGEAVANAVKHGNGLNADQTVEVRCWRNGEEAGFSVEDQGAGVPADRLAHAALPEDPMDTSGRGLFIMKSLADSVWLEEEGRRICLRWSSAGKDS